jgi:hypothetical protein
LNLKQGVRAHNDLSQATITASDWQKKDVLEHLTTGEEDRNTLTPRAVGGVIHLLMHGALDTRENIADRIHEPLTEYTNSKDLQDAIVLLFSPSRRRTGSSITSPCTLRLLGRLARF